MRIGPLEFGTPVVLAPMAGLADAPFRRICIEAGASWAVSEMVVASGRLRGTAMSVRRFAPDNVPLPVVQLLGSEPEVVADAARHARDLGAKMIDINFGCPSKAVCGAACGAAMMRRPELAAEVMRAAAGTAGLPVTVKMRLGWDDASRNALEIAAAAEEAGIAAVTVHARTRAARFSGVPDWKAVREVSAALSIPVVINGSICSPADAIQAIEESGAAALMIGRAATGDPWIFSRVRDVLAGRRDPGQVSREEAAGLVLKHLELHRACWGGGLYSVARFRTHLRAYLSRFGAGEKLVREASAIDDCRRLEELLRRFFSP